MCELKENSTSVFSTVDDFRFSAYEIKTTLDHFKIEVSDLSLGSIATPIHCLDSHKFFKSLVESIASQTSVAIAYYGVPAIVKPLNMAKNVVKQSQLSLLGEKQSN